MRSLHEKIMLYGADRLTDVELVAALLDDEALAERVVGSKPLSALPMEDISRLRMVAGMGLSRATKLAAALEFGRRIAKSSADKYDYILSSSDAIRALRPIFDGLQHEECWVLFMTSSARVVERLKISQGGVQATVVDNRLIFKRALELLASRILIAHNHPSGSAEPSQADIVLTNRIKAAAELFEIQLIDHIIISATDSYSFKSHKLL